MFKGISATEATEVNELVVQVQRSLFELRKATAVLINRAPLAPVPIEHGCSFMEPNPLPLRRSSAGNRPWLLFIATRRLLAPTGEEISLGGTECQILYRVFSSPGLIMRNEELVVLRTYRSTETARILTSKHVRVALSRLRSKVRVLGIDLPLYNVRGTGLHFTGLAEISDL